MKVDSQLSLFPTAIEEIKNTFDSFYTSVVVEQNYRAKNPNEIFSSLEDRFRREDMRKQLISMLESYKC